MLSGTKPKPNEAPATVQMTGNVFEDALRAARSGDPQTARQLVAGVRGETPPFPGAFDFLLGRCLAEASVDLEESIELLRRAIGLSPKNIMAPHVLTLALMRAGRVAEASDMLKSDGLPHDEILLSHLALTMEMQARPWPAALPSAWPPWPTQLGPDPARPISPIDEARENTPLPPVEMTRAQRKELNSIVNRLEKMLHEHRAMEVLREVNAALSSGLDSAELQLLGGLAAEEGGDPVRARVHLAYALTMENHMLMARTFLGRVYWRTGWNELATDLWRSLPIEGPDDYGRHYHLALAHETASDRPAAMLAMHTALRDFFIETREFHIERAKWRWLHFVGSPASPIANGGGSKTS